MAVLGLGPLGPLQFHRQIHPLVDQLAKALVVGNLLMHLVHLFRPEETGAAVAAPGVAELVIRPVLAGVLGVFTAATRPVPRFASL